MSWITWPVRWAWFIVWFGWLVISSNMKVIGDIVAPGQACRPVIARYQTRCRTDVEVWLLGAAVTLTPGTLTLGHRRGEAAPLLYIHAMYETPEELATSVGRIEDMIIQATRRGMNA